MSAVDKVIKVMQPAQVVKSNGEPSIVKVEQVETVEVVRAGMPGRDGRDSGGDFTTDLSLVYQIAKL